MRYRSFIIAALAALSFGTAQAQQVNQQVIATGITKEYCTGGTGQSTLTVTAGTYTTGYVVGGLITLTPFRQLQTGAAGYGGILQSIRLTSKTVQTASFNVYQFSSNPSASTWTDNAAPAINVADVSKVLPPITITSNSGLGTHTVYGTDAIARAHVGASISDYFIITVTGTPTFGSTSDLQFCATYLPD